ncbi:MAG TPA: transposase [Bryobacteraceae bacterium]|jgi:hypothetical protein|nr:transposase [Bryobacteraceae bacterium]
MNGPDAVSEQQLLERAISRLPSGATVIGDRNFGVFSVAYAAEKEGHPTLLRLTDVRAQRLAGKAPSNEMDCFVVWKPSRDDRRSHPGLPTDARVEGRLIVRQVHPNNGAKPFLLALFTTLSSPAEDLLHFYAQRWKIETDLRTLNKELHLDQLTCSTADMAAKEIQMSIAAYNLVRAMICLAAEQSGLSPREYGFTKVRRIIQIFTPQLAAATDQHQTEQVFRLMLHYIQQAKLPHRQCKRPAYPREVWNKGAKFPNRRG